jgi:hypothetical protein
MRLARRSGFMRKIYDGIVCVMTCMDRCLVLGVSSYSM